MDSVSYIVTDGLTLDSDEFDGTSLSSDWTAASWIGTAPSVINLAAQTPTTGATVGAVYKSVDVDASASYQIDIFIAPFNGEHWGDYQIFARMATASPDATNDGIVATLTMTGTSGAFSGDLKDYSGGTLQNTYTFTSGSDGQAEAGWFRVLISGNNVTCTWRGSTLINSQAVTAHTGERVGFGMDATVADGLTLVERFRFQYTLDTTARPLTTTLVASSNGELWRESFVGTMAKLTTDLTLASDQLLHSSERGQKLYIADKSDRRVSGTDGTRGTGDDRLDAASVSDWTAHGIDTDDDVVVISSVGGGATAGTYQISAVASGEITLASNWTSGAGTCTYRIERAPKVYDPAADTLTLWSATTGDVPTGRPLIARYRDRMVLAGGDTDPQNWEMSKAGDPDDWDYSQIGSDAQSAVAGNNANAGEIGEPIKSLMVTSDDYMVFGCRNSLWMLRGDPAYGGQIDALSRTIGVVDGGAWAPGPGGEIYIISRDGLYVIPAGGGMPSSLSREKVPQELRDLSGDAMDVQLAYDVRHRGLWIYLTDPVSASREQWFYSIETGAFWPDTMQGDHEPTSVHAYVSNQAWDDGVLLGCRDGYIRRHHHLFEHDDGSDIDSYVVYGPIAMGERPGREGKWQDMVGVVAQDSGDVTWEVLKSDTFEGIVDASVRETGTWAAGATNRVYPRVRGTVGALKLKGPTKEKWAVERVIVRFERAGRQRV